MRAHKYTNTGRCPRDTRMWASAMKDARRLGQSSSRHPHPHAATITITAVALIVSLVHGHVHAIRDHAKERTRRALHREHVPARAPRRLEHGARVPPVRAQRTARGGVHVVPLRAPAR